MVIRNIEDFKGGWFIGDFVPTVYKTKEFEVCYKKHKKGEKWDRHYHKEALEINYLIRGRMKIRGIELIAGNIFKIKPLEISDPIFLEDCELIVVKTPSVPNDKYII